MATKGAALRKQTGGSWARGQNRDPRRWFGNMLINSLLFLPSGGEGKFPSLRAWADLSESLLMDRIKCKWRRASSRTGGSRPPCREGSKQSRPGWPQPLPKSWLQTQERPYARTAPLTHPGVPDSRKLWGNVCGFKLLILGIFFFFSHQSKNNTPFMVKGKREAEK